MNSAHRRGVSTVIGAVIFLVIMAGAFTAIFVAIQFQQTVIMNQKSLADDKITKINENYSIQACVDDFNNRLYVDAKNLGSTSINFVELGIVNKSDANRPVNFHDLSFKDSFLATGESANILRNKQIILNTGSYEIKTITQNGRILKDVVVVTTPVLPGKFKGIFQDGGDLNAPLGIALRPEGNDLYVASGSNNKVLRYNFPLGNFEVNTFLNYDPNELINPNYIIHRASDNRFYVSSEGTNEVRRFNSDGTLAGIFVTAASGGLSQPQGLAFDPVDGHLLVASRGTNQILKYDGNTGVFIEEFTSVQVNKPRAIIFGGVGIGNDLLVGMEGSDIVVRYNRANGLFVSNFATTNVNNPSGLALTATHLYVSNELAHTITRYDATTGAFVNTFVPKDVTIINKPWGLTISGNDLYIASLNTHTIERWSTVTGNRVGPPPFVTAESGGLSGPKGIVFANNQLNVVSSNTNQVLRYSNTGAFIQVLVSSGNSINTPRALVFTPSDDLLIAGENSKNVLRFSGSPLSKAPGNFINSFVSQSSGGLKNPSGMVYGPNGNLLITSMGTNQILEYNGTTGAFVKVFSTGLNKPRGITVGSDNHLYVSDEGTNSVLKFNGNTGALIGTFVTANSGGLDTPRGLAFGPNGNLFVSSWKTDQILEYNGSTGAFVRVFVAANVGGLDGPTGLFFGPNGDLHVTSELTNNVLFFQGPGDGSGGSTSKFLCKWTK